MKDLQKCKRPWCLSFVSVPETSSELVPYSVSECVYRLFLSAGLFLHGSLHPV